MSSSNARPCDCHDTDKAIEYDPIPRESCGLRQVERPRFFPGQLLTDLDMNATLAWVARRLGHERYRDGWGVACGLHVALHPDCRSTLVVRPGYAVGRCGRDIVVSCTTDVDVTCACPSLDDPCVQRELDCEDDDQDEASDDLEPCRPRKMGGLSILDVYVRYGEKLAKPELALGRNDCAAAVECEATRVHEGHIIDLVRVYDDPCVHPEDLEYEEWLVGYQACFARLARFHRKFARALLFTESIPDDRERFDRELVDMKAELRRWIADAPPATFGFLHDCVCLPALGDIPDDEVEERVEWIRAQVMDTLLHLVLDCRLEYFRRECFAGSSHPGIRLARVWVRSQPGGECEVVKVDDRSPSRRELRRDRAPAGFGMRALSPYIWTRAEDLCRAVDEVGILRPIQRVQLPAFTTPGELYDWFVHEDERRFTEVLHASCDTRLVAYCHDFGPFCERVVAFKAVEDVGGGSEDDGGRRPPGDGDPPKSPRPPRPAPQPGESHPKIPDKGALAPIPYHPKYIRELRPVIRRLAIAEWDVRNATRVWPIDGSRPKKRTER